MPRRARALVVALVLACIVTAALAQLLEVALTPVADDMRPASCVVVLGAAVWNGAPSPVYEARLRYAVERVLAGSVASRPTSTAFLVVTGGVGDGDAVSEAEVGRAWARARGVPAERIVLEDRSRTTAENVAFARALVPTDTTCALARDAGLHAFPAATPYTRYTGVGARARLLASEAWYLAKHRVTR